MAYHGITDDFYHSHVGTIISDNPVPADWWRPFSSVTSSAPMQYRSDLIRDEFATWFALLGIHVWQVQPDALTFFLMRPEGSEGWDFYDAAVIWKDTTPSGQVLSDEDKSSIMSAVEALIKIGEQNRAKNSAR